MGDYVPGTMWKENLRRRNEEKQNEAMLQATLIREEGQRQRTLEARQFEVTTKVFDSFTKAMDDAPPTMKKIMRERLGGVLKELGTRQPFMARALQARYPKEFRKMKLDSVMETIKVPERQLRDGETPETNPAAAAQDYVNNLKTQGLIAKRMGMEAPDIKGTYKAINNDYGIVLTDNEGGWSPVSNTVMNANPEHIEIAKKEGRTYESILNSGGNYGEEFVKVLGTDPTTGQPMEYLYQTANNLFTPPTIKPMFESPKPGSETRFGEPPKPADDVNKFLGALASGKPIRGQDEFARRWIPVQNDIERIGRDIYKNYEKHSKVPGALELSKEAFEVAVEKKIQQYAPGYSVILLPGSSIDEKGNVVTEDNVVVDATLGWFLKNFEINNTSTFKLVYGDRGAVTTSDGKDIEIFVDRANNRVYDADGDLIDGAGDVDNTLRMLQSSTVQELENR